MLRHMTDVLRMWAETGAPDEMRPEDVCDEVFDVVKPHNPARIACADLLVRLCIRTSAWQQCLIAS